MTSFTEADDAAILSNVGPGAGAIGSASTFLTSITLDAQGRVTAVGTPATIGSGLTLAAGVLSANLITGLAGGQTVIGGTAAGENLTLSSTSHGTKGKIVVSDSMVVAAGTLASNAIQHPSNAGTGIYFASATQGVFAANGGVVGSWSSSATVGLNINTVLSFSDGANLILGSTSGTKIGTAITQKLGFWNATPVVQQVLATGAGNTVDNVITFLQTVGLCKQS